ncbi:MAG: hypothetical protein ACI92W_001274 [Paraglaciecola sp.]
MTNSDKAIQRFFIDACGAVISAVMLGYVLIRFETAFGMPEATLYWLAIIPVFYFFYSFFCFLKTPRNWRKYVRAIAAANLSYCALTFGLLFYHFGQFTFLDIGYFVGEMVIIIALALVELRLSNRPVSKQT